MHSFRRTEGAKAVATVAVLRSFDHYRGRRALDRITALSSHSPNRGTDNVRSYSLSQVVRGTPLN